MFPTLFAGVRVRDLAVSTAWYETLLGAEAAFRPNDVEAVWEVGEERYVYIEQDLDRAGHGVVTLFLADRSVLLDWLERARLGGITPVGDEVYENGVRKVTFADPDGNEVGLGAPPSDPHEPATDGQGGIDVG